MSENFFFSHDIPDFYMSFNAILPLQNVEKKYDSDDSLIDFSGVPQNTTHLTIIGCNSINSLRSLKKLPNL